MLRPRRDPWPSSPSGSSSPNPLKPLLRVSLPWPANAAGLSSGPLVALPAVVVEGMVFRSRVRSAAAVAAQAILGVVRSQMVGIAWDQRALMRESENEEENHEKDHQAEDHGHAAVQTALTSVRRGASLPWAGWRPAPSPELSPVGRSSRRWRPRRPGC